MPVARCNSQIPVPPPSPIPTARGSRSAANEIFSEFLEKSLQLPELTMPESHLSPVPAEIDLRSLPVAAADTMIRSAREFGAFRIRSHGISGNELGTVMDEAEHVFQNWRNAVVELNTHGGEMIPCVRSREGALEFAADKILGSQNHRNFWVHMGNVASRFDNIVEQVSLALQQDKSKELKKWIQETECVIYLCRYRHNNAKKQNEKSLGDQKKERLCDHALRFYLPMEHCIFYVQSERGPLSFDAGPESLVVTVGKQLEEWSNGELKCAPGEMIFMPCSQSCEASFSIELVCSAPSNLNHTLNNSGDKNNKIISLTDQIIFVLCLALLYKFFWFIFS